MSATRASSSAETATTRSRRSSSLIFWLTAVGGHAERGGGGGEALVTSDREERRETVEGVGHGSIMNHSFTAHPPFTAFSSQSRGCILDGVGAAAVARADTRVKERRSWQRTKRSGCGSSLGRRADSARRSRRRRSLPVMRSWRPRAIRSMLTERLRVDRRHCIRLRST